MTEENRQDRDPITELARIRLAEEMALRAKREEHAELLGDSRFQDALRSLRRTSNDFVSALRGAWFAATRDPGYANHSLLHRSIDDWIQSAIAISSMAGEGVQTPARRELRYMLELGVRVLHLDQQHSGLSFAERVRRFGDERIVFDDLTKQLALWFDETESDRLAMNLREAHGDACAFVHPSRRQLEERLRRESGGAYIGFDTPEQLEQLNEAVKRVYDLVLALVFHGIGQSATGDLFIEVLDEQKNWRFHRTKWVSRISSMFDYKWERQHPEEHAAQKATHAEMLQRMEQQIQERVAQLRTSTEDERQGTTPGEDQ